MADTSRDVTTRQVPATTGRLHVCDHAGDEPALVLMHGFLDDSRIYDRLVPLLSPRRAVAFDASLLPRADLHLVVGASHWPQWDRREAVSELIR
jgi:pimeloyl-ACP methyl ester carboxylesterase